MLCTIRYSRELAAGAKLDGLPMPDRPITSKILEHFSGEHDFIRWAQYFSARSPQFRNSGYGLLLADARNWPENRELAGGSTATSAPGIAKRGGIPAEPPVKYGPKECYRCDNGGLFERRPLEWAWCDCQHGERRREREPDLIDRKNSAPGSLAKAEAQGRNGLASEGSTMAGFLAQQERARALKQVYVP